MILRIRPFGRPRGRLCLGPVPNLKSAFATRRAIFGPHELREDRITADGYLADDLSFEARRVLRSGEVA